jgi:hypothetical protein
VDDLASCYTCTWQVRSLLLHGFRLNSLFDMLPWMCSRHHEFMLVKVKVPPVNLRRGWSSGRHCIVALSLCANTVDHVPHNAQYACRSCDFHALQALP